MLAVLSTVLDPSMTSETKWVIAGLGMTMNTIWYVLVAMVLSNSSILTRIQNNQRNQPNYRLTDDWFSHLDRFQIAYPMSHQLLM